jgi:hypothetical protein
MKTTQLSARDELTRIIELARGDKSRYHLERRGWTGQGASDTAEELYKAATYKPGYDGKIKPISAREKEIADLAKTENIITKPQAAKDLAQQRASVREHREYLKNQRFIEADVVTNKTGVHNDLHETLQKDWETGQRKLKEAKTPEEAQQVARRTREIQEKRIQDAKLSAKQNPKAVAKSSRLAGMSRREAEGAKSRAEFIHSSAKGLREQTSKDLISDIHRGRRIERNIARSIVPKEAQRGAWRTSEVMQRAREILPAVENNAVSEAHSRIEKRLGAFQTSATKRVGRQMQGSAAGLSAGEIRAAKPDLLAGITGNSSITATTSPGKRQRWVYIDGLGKDKLSKRGKIVARDRTAKIGGKSSDILEALNAASQKIDRQYQSGQFDADSWRAKRKTLGAPAERAAHQIAEMHPDKRAAAVKRLQANVNRGRQAASEQSAWLDRREQASRRRYDQLSGNARVADLEKLEKDWTRADSKKQKKIAKKIELRHEQISTSADYKRRTVDRILGADGIDGNAARSPKGLENPLAAQKPRTWASGKAPRRKFPKFGEPLGTMKKIVKRAQANIPQTDGMLGRLPGTIIKETKQLGRNVWGTPYGKTAIIGGGIMAAGAAAGQIWKRKKDRETQLSSRQVLIELAKGRVSRSFADLPPGESFAMNDEAFQKWKEQQRVEAADEAPTSKTQKRQKRQKRQKPQKIKRSINSNPPRENFMKALIAVSNESHKKGLDYQVGAADRVAHPNMAEKWSFQKGFTPIKKTRPGGAGDPRTVLRVGFPFHEAEIVRPTPSEKTGRYKLEIQEARNVAARRIKLHRAHQRGYQRGLGERQVQDQRLRDLRQQRRRLTYGIEVLKDEKANQKRAAKSKQEKLRTAFEKEKGILKAKGSRNMKIAAGAALAGGLGIGTIGGLLVRRKEKEHQFTAGVAAESLIHAFSKKDKKKGMNPYVMATLSGGASGAVLGALPILTRGTPLRTVGKSMLASGLISGGIVGGGAKIGSKIIGEPRENEGSAFTRRAAMGGVMVGGATGLAGGILLKSRGLRKLAVGLRRRYPKSKAAAFPQRALSSMHRGLNSSARTFSPAEAIRKAGPIGAAAMGAGAGGVYGLYQGLDEGQQVDSILNIRKDLKMSSRGHAIEFQKGGDNRQIVVKHRYQNQIDDAEWARKEKNFMRSGIVGGGLGLLLRKKLPLSTSGSVLSGIGAGIGAQGVVQMLNPKDEYKDKSVRAKKVESLPWKAGIGAGLGMVGYGIIKKRMRPIKFSSRKNTIQFNIADELLTSTAHAHVEQARRQAKTRGILKEISAEKRRAGMLRRTYDRTKALISDTKLKLSGKKKYDARGRERKNEWDKSWVRNVAITGGLGLALWKTRKPFKAMTKEAEILRNHGQRGVGMPGLWNAARAFVIKDPNAPVSKTILQRTQGGVFEPIGRMVESTKGAFREGGKIMSDKATRMADRLERLRTGQQNINRAHVKQARRRKKSTPKEGVVIPMDYTKRNFDMSSRNHRAGIIHLSDDLEYIPVGQHIRSRRRSKGELQKESLEQERARNQYEKRLMGGAALGTGIVGTAAWNRFSPKAREIRRLAAMNKADIYNERRKNKAFEKAVLKKHGVVQVATRAAKKVATGGRG